MWILNNNTNQWSIKSDTLPTSNFDLLLQDAQSFAFYQNCLFGSTYVASYNLNNIYDILTYYIPSTYNYWTSFIPYVNPYIGSIQNEVPITSSQSQYDFLNKFIPDYGLTLKNLFTPIKTIDTELQNLVYVDVATTAPLINIGTYSPNLVIDGINIIEGQRILVKDQFDQITIPSSTDPSTFFPSYYILFQTIGTDTTYLVPDVSNGIYGYTNSSLIRQTDLDEYSDLINYAACVQFGNINSGLQFNLSRLTNGFFPEYYNGDSIYFTQSHNYVVRNSVDYDNLYDVTLQDTIKSITQSIYFNGITYSIPQRTITIGEYGVIINTQESISNIIPNSKYKNEFNSIDEVTNYYWACGDGGLLLQISKVDFSMTKISLSNAVIPNPGSIQNPTINQNSGPVITNLNSISFFNDLNGVVVGEFNQIWYTSDGGITWNRHYIPTFDGFNYNKVLFTGTSNFYVGGDSGVFIEFSYSSNIWTAYKRRVYSYTDSNENDEYLLVSNVIDMNYFTDTSGVLATGSNFIALGCENNNIYLRDLNNVYSDNDFLFLGVNNTFGDITSISYVGSTSSLFFSTIASIYEISNIFTATFSGTYSNVMAVTISNFFTQSGINKIFTYEDNEIVVAGNDSIWLDCNFTDTFSSVYDPNYFNKIKPRFLFLDYDIGSKLYWFDDYEQYRIPSAYIIPVNYLIGTLIHDISQISFSGVTDSVYDANLNLTYSYVENNWITYWSDKLKTFEYYTQMDENHVVEPSFLFSGNDDIGGSFTYSSSDITILYSEIQNLMPDATYSRYRLTPTNISTPSTIYDLYFYSYLGIWALTLSYIAIAPSVGDVINISSDVVEGNFIINNIFTQIIDPSSPTSSIVYYQYFYTNFNENIINDLSQIDEITLTNLNKYPISATNSIDIFLSNFNTHYISNAYTIATTSVSFPGIGLTTSFEIMGAYTQYSAYYNLQAQVDSIWLNGNITQDQILYDSEFLDFGYSPTYNILSYLNFINDTIFTPTKEFLALPQFINIPGPGSYPTINNSDLIYIDISYPTNILIFGSNLQNLWESFFVWTFVDVILNVGGNPGEYPQSGLTSITTQRLLIIDSYQDVSTGNYIIEFHDVITGYTPTTNICSINIFSRRQLQQISDDLQYANRLQRPQWNVQEIEAGMTYSNYGTNITFKVPTDSYCKALLSDSQFVQNITGVVYTDYNYELSLQITKLEDDYILPVAGVIESLNGNYLFSFGEPHGLSNEDSLVVQLYSTQSITPNYPFLLGYHNVLYIDNYTLEIEIPYVSSVLPMDNLQCYFIKKDNFLDFRPIDLFDVGVGDKKIKQAIDILPENFDILPASSPTTTSQYILVNIDFNQYTFQLIDGLDLDLVNSQYFWLLQAEINGAVIGMDKNQNLIWYTGTWECGRWFGGHWISGTWESGDWYTGTWDSLYITNKSLSVTIDNVTSNPYNSIWLTGNWYDGIWNQGTWYDGNFFAGTWSNGVWYDGTFNNGLWQNGQFNGGIWVDGTWMNGTFNENVNLSYWLNGNWYGGDFENGTWYNGTFNQSSGNLSRFGTNATNTTPAIWYGGKFLNGEFHSNLNLNPNGLPDVSLIHKFSTWSTGFFSGIFYGGNVSNINCKSGTWKGGILNDIEIIGIDSYTNTFLLNGIFMFNPLDEFYVMDNMVTGTYSIFGSTTNPTRYRILNAIIDDSTNQTSVYVDLLLSDISVVNFTGYTGLRATSYFSNSSWESGIWFNGYFENSNFNGGIWYNGYFNGGNWG